MLTGGTAACSPTVALDFERVVILGEDIVPDTGGNLFSLVLTDQQINASGDVAFGSFLGDENGLIAPLTPGVWARANGAYQQLIIRGDDAPGVPGATLDNFEQRWLDDAGSFYATSRLVAPALTTDERSLVWRRDAMEDSAVLRGGSPVPRIPGALFGDLSNAIVYANPSRRFVIEDELAVGPGGVTSSNDATIWARDPDGSFTLLAREGDPMVGIPERTTAISRRSR